MATFTCARCKVHFRDVRSSGSSSLYGSDHTLCEPCFFAEDAQIDEEGTNNLPDTLASYGPPNGY
ncbi:p095 [Rhizobium phage 16-3]|uniref:p095 n=1 Tax=Rhizobium phage 16-3 TaxID=10704 RepID=UPI00017BA658|nr:p095 [Rhizobium phage 16-3]ABF71343.1 p095 [Rhizobium phage 16-3]